MKHSRVERSRSPTPILPPYDPNAPEFLEENLRMERKAHEALVGDNGRPCYPIELGFEVFDNSGQYEDIFEYWRGESGYHRSQLMFSAQLERWEKFRRFQQKNRRYFIFHSRFPEFQQKVLERRRRHGLDGDVQLLEEQSKQSGLDDWMEYQDYELRESERLENEYREDEARLVSRRKALADAGVSAFEEIQELEFGTYYSLAVKCSGEEWRAKEKEELAERKLRLAEKRLKAAELDELGERVERATWVRLFLKEVESAQMRLDKLQRLAEDAERESEPFNRWLQARHNEWDEFSEEGKRLVRLEVESTEFQDQKKKRRELVKKAYEARSMHFRAKEEVEYAEEGYKAAQSDEIRETIERAALIKVTQEEVRSAQTRFEEARELTEKIELKGKVISALSYIPLTRGKIKRHNVLLEWIEQQRQKIAGGRADIEKEGGQGRSKRASLRVLQNHPATEPSRANKPPRANGRTRKQLTPRSILNLVNPAKVSKAPSKRRSSHRKMSVPCDASQAAEKMTTDSSAPEPRSKQAFKVRDAMPASLHPIHSSRVSKPGAKRPTGLRRGGTKLTPTTDVRRRTREDNLGTSSTSSTDRKAIQQSANASLQRSTRTTKPPERFHPG